MQILNHAVILLLQSYCNLDYFGSLFASRCRAKQGALPILIQTESMKVLQGRK